MCMSYVISNFITQMLSYLILQNLIMSSWVNQMQRYQVLRANVTFVEQAILMSKSLKYLVKL